MYIYIYIYTRVCLCGSAHREERWTWSEVATTLSRSDPTVLSRTLSQIRPQNTITNSITTSIATRTRRFGRVGTIEKWKLYSLRFVCTIEERKHSYFGSVGTIEEWKLSQIASVGAIEERKLSYTACVGTIEGWKLYTKSVNYHNVENAGVFILQRRRQLHTWSQE